MDARRQPSRVRDRRRRRAVAAGQGARAQARVPFRAHPSPWPRARRPRRADLSRVDHPRAPPLPSRMSAPPAPTGIVFLPGFDGVAELREPFARALSAQHPAPALGYPNRALATLNADGRDAASQLVTDSRPVLA